MEDINGLYGFLRRAGHKVTHARRSVIATLAETNGHLTAPDVVQAVQMREPGVGRASVYRTLELLTRLGLVQSSTLGGGAATYVLTPNRHHHHVVCVECHKTVEFDDCVMPELEVRLGERLGFQFEGHLVELYGRCPDCLQ
jgi:Fur family ferric uptake transcriptional regulator